MDPKSDLLLQTTGCTWLRPISMFLGVPLDQVRTLVKFSEFVEKLCLRRMRFVYLVYLVLGEFGTVWKGVCCGHKTRTLPFLLLRRWTLSCARCSAWLPPSGFVCVSVLSGPVQLCVTPSLVSWGRHLLYSASDGKSDAVSLFKREIVKPAGPVPWPLLSHLTCINFTQPETSSRPAGIPYTFLSWRSSATSSWRARAHTLFTGKNLLLNHAVQTWFTASHAVL